MTQSMFQLLVAPRGRGPCVAISGEQPYPGWSRRATVSGSFPPIPWHWTVGISPRGEGLTGRRNLFPLPCLPHSNHRMSWRPPLRPRPQRGAGAVLAISGEQPYPGYSRWKAVSGSFPPIPWHWTVGISPLGEGLTGRGNLFPLPCLQLPRYRNPRCPTPPAPSVKDTRTLLPASPAPPAPRRSSPTPTEGR